MTQQQGGFWISTEQMYTEVRATHDGVQEVRSELRGLREDLGELRGLESRVRALENRMSGWIPAGGLLGGLAGAATAAYTALRGG